MLYLYKFEVKHLDEFANDPYIAKGTVAGCTYRDALDTLVDYFDEDTIIDVKLSMIEDSEHGLLISDDSASIIKQNNQ